jgi:hypothetical protein
VRNAPIWVLGEVDHVLIKNNVVEQKAGMVADGYRDIINVSSGTGYQISDVRIVNNTGIAENPGSRFASFRDDVQQFVLSNNLYTASVVAPAVQLWGGFTTSNLPTRFLELTANVWADPDPSVTTDAINRIGTTSTYTDYDQLDQGRVDGARRSDRGQPQRLHPSHAGR